MAEVLGNKNVTHCRNFFINHRTRFNLVEVLAEYEKENNIPCDQSKLNDWSEEQVENEEMYTSQENEIGEKTKWKWHSLSGFDVPYNFSISLN